MKLFTIFAAAALVLAVSTARADVTTNYPGSACKVSTTQYENLVTNSGGVFTAKASNVQLVEAVCPVTKFTSGPAIDQNDNIAAGTLTQYSPNAGDVSCSLRVYKSLYESGDYWNVGVSTDADSTVAGTQVLAFDSNSFQGYWQQGGLGQGWYYANIVCLLPPGSQIHGYSIRELGTRQTGYEIHSTAECTRAPASAYFFGTGDVVGGYWQAASGGPFSLNCPIPAASSRGAQVAVAPSINAQSWLECSHDGTRYSAIPSNPGLAEWPSKFQEFAFASGDRTLNCRRSGPNTVGDPKVLSYRTLPLTAYSHTGWTATAYNGAGSNPGNAINASTTDRWTTGNPQTNAPVEGQWFQVDLGASRKFEQIVVDASASNNDFPRGYKVYASATNGNWGAAIASGTGSGNVVTIQVPPTTARYVRVTQTGASTQWWSITRFDVYRAVP